MPRGKFPRDDMPAAKDRCAINIRGVPKDLRRQFEVVCVLRGVSMTQRIIQMMERDIETAREAFASHGQWRHGGPPDPTLLP